MIQTIEVLAIAALFIAIMTMTTFILWMLSNQKVGH